MIGDDESGRIKFLDLSNVVNHANISLSNLAISKEVGMVTQNEMGDNNCDPIQTISYDGELNNLVVVN